MLLTLTEANISLSKGALDIIRSKAIPYEPHLPSLSYGYNDEIMVKFYKKGSMLFIEAEKSDIHFKLDIDSLQYTNIKVNIGSIEASALATVDDNLSMNIGAIQVTVKKEEVGDLHMQVNAGIIITTPSLIKVAPFGGHGCEAYYKGGLKGQKTELFVNVGAILCTIL